MIAQSSEHEDDRWDHKNNRPKFATFCINMLEQERRAVRSILSESYAIVGGEAPTVAETPWAKDRALVRGDELLEWAFLSVGFEHFQRLAHAADDYIDSLIAIINHDRLLTQPAWSSSRGVMESVLTSCWLLDATKPSEMRVARALSLLPSIYQGAIDTLEKFPNQKEELTQKRQARGDLIAAYKKHNVEISWKYNKRQERTDTTTAVVFRDNKAPFSRNVTQLAEAYLPREPWLYPLLSGAAHSELWLLSGMNSESLEQAVSAIFLPLFAFSEAYIHALCNYFGLDSRKHLAANQRRLTAIARRAGMHAPIRPDRPTAFGALGSGYLEEFTSR